MVFQECERLKKEIYSDWKVKVTLDRDLLEEEIHFLLRIMKRQRVNVVVFASNKQGAIEEAQAHLEKHMDVPRKYVKAYNPRRMPT
jgi:translation elongation factor EF-1beta